MLTKASAAWPATMKGLRPRPPPHCCLSWPVRTICSSSKAARSVQCSKAITGCSPPSVWSTRGCACRSPPMRTATAWRQAAHCYAIWGKERRCNNCIAQEAIRTPGLRARLNPPAAIFFTFWPCASRSTVSLTRRNAPTRSKPAAVRKICSISCWYATGRSTSIPPPTKYIPGSK